jgi:hypothetical protein
MAGSAGSEWLGAKQSRIMAQSKSMTVVAATRIAIQPKSGTFARFALGLSRDRPRGRSKIAGFWRTM